MPVKMVSAVRQKYGGRQIVSGELFEADPDDVDGLVYMRWADVFEEDVEEMKKSEPVPLLLPQGSYARRDMLAQHPPQGKRKKRQYRRRDITSK